MTNVISINQIKTAYRCSWLKIFHHDIDVDVFHNESEAKYSLKKGKFSILGLVNDNFKIEGKFEFLLEYPDKANKQGMNRWAQNKNPLDEAETTNGKVDGYEPITLSWEASTDSYAFSGLARSESSSSLLDGTSTEGTWYFSVGAYKKYNYKYLPGYTPTNTEVILWMRVREIFLCSPKSTFSVSAVFSIFLFYEF